MAAPFKLPDGAPFARVFDTAERQILVTIEVNDDDNAAIVLRSWTGAGLAEVWLHVRGTRAARADALFVESLAPMEPAGVLAAWKLAAGEEQR